MAGLALRHRGFPATWVRTSYVARFSTHGRCQLERAKQRCARAGGKNEELSSYSLDRRGADAGSAGRRSGRPRDHRPKRVDRQTDLRCRRPHPLHCPDQQLAGGVAARAGPLLGDQLSGVSEHQHVPVVLQRRPVGRLSPRAQHLDVDSHRADSARHLQLHGPSLGRLLRELRRADWLLHGYAADAELPDESVGNLQPHLRAARRDFRHNRQRVVAGWHGHVCLTLWFTRVVYRLSDPHRGRGGTLLLLRNRQYGPEWCNTAGRLSHYIWRNLRRMLSQLYADLHGYPVKLRRGQQPWSVRTLSLVLRYGTRPSNTAVSL